MSHYRKYFNQGLILCFSFCLLFFSCFSQLIADEINWKEVARTNNEIQFIDSNSIKYNNSGFLSAITKYIELNPEDQKTISSNSYLIAIDCEKRLYNKFPVNSEFKQVKKWISPNEDKLIKLTIINSCSF